MSVSFVDAIRIRDDAIDVPMNQVRACTWDSKRYLATAGLNGCTAVAIISMRAGILAHIAPIPVQPLNQPVPPNAVRDNVVRVMQQVIRAYNTAASLGLFPQPNSLVLAAFYEGTLGMSEQVGIIRQVLHHMSLPMQVKVYQVRTIGESRGSGDTSLVVEGRSNMPPQIYVNGEEWRDHSSGQAEDGEDRDADDGDGSGANEETGTDREEGDTDESDRDEGNDTREVGEGSSEARTMGVMTARLVELYSRTRGQTEHQARITLRAAVIAVAQRYSLTNEQALSELFRRTF